MNSMWYFITKGSTIVILLFTLSMCRNSDRVIQYYPTEFGEKKIRTITYYENGEVIRYEHYGLRDSIAFSYNYKEPYTRDNPKGKALIYTMFDKEPYRDGDTMIIWLEVINPPEIEVTCEAYIDGRVIESKLNDKYQYIIRTVYRRSMDTMRVHVPVAEGGEPWFTYRIKFDMTYDRDIDSALSL